ncbi:hypothetical protein B0H17DRAFT_1199023 [Mycena rosella]|uniref:Uncharacterized protein n=1 Tax=Mycena rosella TaxID=1033263 RepID=A0AAD7DMV2_MYCRO|nr:hypothetical protein B0H17DRAFT_1199023 [Mycena rosella]
MSPLPYLDTASAIATSASSVLPTSVESASALLTSASFLPTSVESASSAVHTSASSLAASVASASASPTSASSLPTPTPSINPWAWVPPLNIPSWTPLLILPFFVGMFIYVVYAAWKAPKVNAPNPNPSKAQTTRSFSERMAEVRARMGDADIARPAPVYPAAADNAAPGSDRFTAVTPLKDQRRSVQVLPQPAQSVASIRPAVQDVEKENSASTMLAERRIRQTGKWINNSSISPSFGAGFEVKLSIPSLVLARPRRQSDVQDPRPHHDSKGQGASRRTTPRADAGGATKSPRTVLWTRSRGLKRLLGVIPTTFVPVFAALTTAFSARPNLAARADEDLALWFGDAVTSIFPNHTGWDTSYAQYFDLSLVASFNQGTYNFTTLEGLYSVLGGGIAASGYNEFAVAFTSTTIFPSPSDAWGITVATGVLSAYRNGTLVEAATNGVFARIAVVDGERKFTEWHEISNFHF